ncbi:MAG: aminotransferase class V-fold PLP-dependent enzyme [Candidatus Jordarchaeum sp.]|uniref:aminotransferase class V-fold PLP-dependent enzyme n=1 Tax=Candidatus Jordarchaeum sp. TaxID=2823881 RepID=UPI00404A6671
MAIKEILADFPITEKVNYLNTASIGLVPKTVIERTKDFFIDLTRGGTLTLDEEKEAMVYDGLREEGAKLLECNAKDIAIFNSVSEAMNSIAWSLELKEGKVVSTDIEFPSVTYPWLRIAWKESINVKLVNAENWRVSMDDLLNEIDEGTRVVVLSHVEFLNGQKFDLKEIAKRVHEVGGILVVDGIQAAGYLPLNVREMAADVYITGSYKWLTAPFGTAIACISKKLCDKLEPAIVGWRSTEDMWNFNARELTFAATARKFEYSTSAYDVKLGLVESIKYLRKIGIENIYNHNMELNKLLSEELGSIEGVEIITPENRGSIVTFKIKGRDSKKVAEKMRELKRPVELSVRLNMIRLSPHVYNTEADILQFVENLKQILKKI